MNCPANTKPWQVGDIVIHDADAKEYHMLMKVICVSQETGLFRTRYLFHPEYNILGKIYNTVRFLHDPRKFGIIVPNDAEVLMHSGKHVTQTAEVRT